MKKTTRFLTKDQDGLGSTTGTVIWGHNHLNQLRQFAFDGIQWFYQPTTREPFIKVTTQDVPKSVQDSMHHHRNAT